MYTAQVVREPLCYLWKMDEEGHWDVSTEASACIIDAPLNLNRRHWRYSSATDCLSMLDHISGDMIFSAV